MGFAGDITPEEAAVGFDARTHLVHGTIVRARLGNGICAVKMISAEGKVWYAICDDALVVLYEPAGSLFDLRRRFGLGERRSA